MLASPNKFMHRIHFPAIAQIKVDGMRANIIHTDGKTIVYSRNGKIMEMFGRFDKSTPPETVLDGEFIVQIDGQTLDRKSGNGILHKAVVGTISKEETEMIKMIVFDLISYEHWQTGVYDKPYANRWKDTKIQAKLHPELYEVVETFDVNNMSDVTKLYKKVIRKGEEGLVVKNADSSWENKRSKNMIKMKEVLEMDLKITEWVEGDGKYQGMLGKFMCTNKDGTIIVGVGTGYSDRQRMEYDKSLVGKICSVQYNEIITSRDKDTKSLFLPVFVEIRDDKDTPD